MKEFDPTSSDAEPMEQIQAETPALPSEDDLTFVLDLDNIDAILGRYRTYRAKRIYPEDACFFLICSTLEMVARQKCLEADYHSFRHRAKAEIEPPDQQKTEPVTQSKAFTVHMNERYMDIFIEVLESHGEMEMASLFAANPRIYRERREKGRLFFRSVSTPQDG